mmetsp:Transcript_41631/g.93939  ORF Transcript_41631/g.93939 Transcript_41631/m.93939 type:complete len:633 (+) Transcript_41631:188-2086(+)
MVEGKVILVDFLDDRWVSEDGPPQAPRTRQQVLEHKRRRRNFGRVKFGGQAARRPSSLHLLERRRLHLEPVRRERDVPRVHEVRVGGHGHGLPVLEERPGGDAHCEPLPLEGVRQQGPGVAAERAVARDQVGQALARDFPKVVHERLESLAQDLSPEKVEPLDLGRALPHRRDPHVAVHLFGPIVLDITVTAVDLNSHVGCFFPHLGEKSLEDGCKEAQPLVELFRPLARRAPLGPLSLQLLKLRLHLAVAHQVGQLGTLEAERAPPLRHRLHEQKHVPHLGVVDDGVGNPLGLPRPAHAPHAHAFFGVPQAVLEGHLGRRHPLQGRPHSRGVDEGEHVPHPLVLGPDEPPSGPVKLELAGGRPVAPHLLLEPRASHAVGDCARRYPRAAPQLRDEEEGEAPRALGAGGGGRGVGESREDAVVDLAAAQVVLPARDEELAARELVHRKLRAAAACAASGPALFIATACTGRFAAFSQGWARPWARPLLRLVAQLDCPGPHLPEVAPTPGLGQAHGSRRRPAYQLGQDGQPAARRRLDLLQLGRPVQKQGVDRPLAQTGKHAPSPAGPGDELGVDQAQAQGESLPAVLLGEAQRGPPRLAVQAVRLFVPRGGPHRGLVDPRAPIGVAPGVERS